MVSKKILEQIVAAADIKKTDYILEVGGGAGTLTQQLAARAKEVVVIEKDPQLIGVLHEVLKDFANVHITEADALKLRELPYAHGAQRWRIVANIPYWITGRFLRRVLESSNPPADIILMVQKEIAERICAAPPHMSLLAVSVQYYGTPEILINDIAPDNFWPPSGVDSSIIRIKVAKKKRGGSNNEAFFTIVRAGFTHPRKQLRANLKRAFNLDSRGVDEIFTACNVNIEARAQELSIEDWKCLQREIVV